MTALHPDSSMRLPADAGRLIGVFDSGVGGLSILQALRRAMPCTPLLYVADSGHAPYGERNAAFIVDRCLRVTQWLVEHGATTLVVACNTATAWAIDTLRARWPTVPIVGVEPGIKPALALSHNARIGVLATPRTLASLRFRELVVRHATGATVIAQPCAGLAALIEEVRLDAPELARAIDACCAPLVDSGVDTVVLGCTHYSLVRPLIQHALGPQVWIVDTAQAVAQQAARRASASMGMPCTFPTRLYTTGAAQRLSTAAGRWLDFPCEVRSAPL